LQSGGWDNDVVQLIVPKALHLLSLNRMGGQDPSKQQNCFGNALPTIDG
jgi:hypothetical protein